MSDETLSDCIRAEQWVKYSTDVLMHRQGEKPQSPNEWDRLQHAFDAGWAARYPEEDADNKQLLKWAYARIEESCPHILKETVEGRFFEKRVTETALSNQQSGRENE